MRKNILVLMIIISGFSQRTYAQDKIQADSSINAFRTYLLKNVRFPTVAAENNVQGKMVVSIHLNSKKMIDSIWFDRHIFPECDSEVVKKIRQYSKPLILTGSEYAVGFQFIITREDEPEEKLTPFKISAYKHFLFGIEIRRVVLKRATTIVY